MCRKRETRLRSFFTLVLVVLMSKMIESQASPDALHRQQIAYYQQHAASYDQSHPGGRTSRCHRQKLLHIAEKLRLQAGDRVLEVGVGTGVHADWIQRLCDINIAGIDLSPEMIDIARARLGDTVDLRIGAAESLPFESESFDGIFCCATLHHVADKQQAVCEMARVVKPGGRIAFSEPNILNPLNMRQWMFIPEEKGQLEVRRRNITRWFKQAGLEFLDFGYLNFTPPKPEFLSGLFDGIDRVCPRVPLLRLIGSVIVFTGQRPAE